jgi:carbamoyl-phosphate synthase large subunit
MPFVSKVLRTNLIELATKVMLGIQVEKPHKSVFELDYVGVKAPQFSFSRLAKADPVLGVDMASTGEVGCIGEGFYEAILKAMFSVGYRVPQKSILLSTGPARSKVELINSARALREKGHKLYATRGTCEFSGMQESSGSCLLARRGQIAEHHRTYKDKGSRPGGQHTQGSFSHRA